MITMPFLPRAIRELRVTRTDGGEELNLVETEKRLPSAPRIDGLEPDASGGRARISRKQLRTKMKHHGLLPEELTTL